MKTFRERLRLLKESTSSVAWNQHYLAMLSTNISLVDTVNQYYKHINELETLREAFRVSTTESDRDSKEIVKSITYDIIRLTIDCKYRITNSLENTYLLSSCLDDMKEAMEALNKVVKITDRF